MFFSILGVGDYILYHIHIFCRTVAKTRLAGCAGWSRDCWMSMADMYILFYKVISVTWVALLWVLSNDLSLNVLLHILLWNSCSHSLSFIITSESEHVILLYLHLRSSLVKTFFWCIMDLSGFLLSRIIWRIGQNPIIGWGVNMPKSRQISPFGSRPLILIHNMSTSLIWSYIHIWLGDHIPI